MNDGRIGLHSCMLVKSMKDHARGCFAQGHLLSETCTDQCRRQAWPGGPFNPSLDWPPLEVQVLGGNSIVALFDETMELKKNKI
jgi:hypothetical protein